MTVSTEVDHNEYTGNGVTTTFPYTFRIFHKSNLIVQVVDLNENITILALDTDYTVTGAGGYAGGNVILTVALANGYQISISRELPVTQETDLRNQGKFFAEVHEDAFDKLTMLIQQVRSWFSLALRRPSFVANYYDALNNYIRNLRDPVQQQDAATKNYVDAVSNTNLRRTLRVPEADVNLVPNVDFRKNKVFTWDNDGQPSAALPPSGSATDVLIELAKPTGAGLIGLEHGTVAHAINFVTPEMFMYSGQSVSGAIQACADYARLHKLPVRAAATYILDANVKLDSIEWSGGVFKGTGNISITALNLILKQTEITGPYIKVAGGKCRFYNNIIHEQSYTAAIFISGMVKPGDIEICNNEFYNCNYAILQQASGEIMRWGRYAANNIHDIKGDGIELNVVNKHYPQGFIIENNLIDNIDGQGPNWGIGIGIAGAGPYGIDTPDANYVANFVVRGNRITRTRQCIHMELCRDFTVSDNELYPDVSKSQGAGLTFGGIVTYGCKSFTVDGVSGEPDGSTRMVLLEWGVNAGQYAGPPRDFTLRNITTQRGTVEVQTAGANDWTNTVVLENIRCGLLKWRGLPSSSVFRNIYCNQLDVIGQPLPAQYGNPAEGSGAGIYTRSHFTYMNWNGVVCLSDVHSDVSVSKLYLDRCDQQGNNFTVPLDEDGAGHRGTRLFSVTEQYQLKDDVFPGGRYFPKGTILWKAGGTGGFKITVAGSYIKTAGSVTDKIKSTAPGDKTIRANGITWATGEGAKSAGTRLRIPGAGAGGADLITTVVRSPYVVNSVWVIDIDPPVLTATPENMQIYAAEPVSFIEF